MNLSQVTKCSVRPVQPRLVWLAVLALGCHATPAGASPPPRLDFDVPFSVCCRSVACAGPAKTDPGKDLIEVIVPISVRVRAGSEKDLKECLYTLVDATDPPALSVRDWLPRTELKTEFAKPIQVNNERLAKVGITVSARYAVTASGDAMGQVKSGVAYEMLPPQEIVLASGTVQHGHGVFFKLKPSSQTTLEGMKSFSAIFAVPHGWRGGCLRLRCQAVGLSRGLLRPFDREVDSGRAVFCVALYAAGDAQAAALADRVATCQQELMGCLVPDRRPAGSAWEKSLPLLGRLVGRAGFMERQSAGTDDAPAGGDPALLHDALDRATTHAEPPEQLPRPAGVKLCALQGAVEALQSLSAGNIRAAGRIEQARRAALVKTLPPAETVVSAGGASKGTSAPAAGARTSAVVAKIGWARPGAATLPPPSAGRSSNAPARAGDGKQTRAEAIAPPDHACKRGRFPPEILKQPWYVLASIGGALFTCILAPVVVEVIRKRINAGR
jgi:hypothetical protein